MLIDNFQKDLPDVMASRFGLRVQALDAGLTASSLKPKA
jgi:hypothetical protein